MRARTLFISRAMIVLPLLVISLTSGGSLLAQDSDVRPSTVILGDMALDGLAHFAQDSSARQSTAILGDMALDGLAHFVIRLEVVDSYDGMPVRGAEVILGDGEDRRIAVMSTDQDGLAVILMRQSWDLARYTPLVLTVRATRREQWKRRLEEDELLDDAEYIGFWIPRKDYRGDLTDQLIFDAT